MDWNQIQGEEFGLGTILTIEPGQVLGPFVHVGTESVDTELGPVTVFIARNEHGELVRMPIAASFVKAASSARLVEGNEYWIRRGQDVIKRSGPGKGNKIQTYALKVTKR